MLIARVAKRMELIARETRRRQLEAEAASRSATESIKRLEEVARKLKDTVKGDSDGGE